MRLNARAFGCTVSVTSQHHLDLVSYFDGVGVVEADTLVLYCKKRPKGLGHTEMKNNNKNRKREKCISFGLMSVLVKKK